MGAIRKGLLVIVSVLIFIGLLLMNCLFIISNSLEYENIQKELTPALTDVADEDMNIFENLEDMTPFLIVHCENNSEFIFSKDGQTFNISCESIRNGSDAIMNESASDFVHEIYYKDYDCSFINCFENGDGSPFFLVSKKTYEYSKSKFYFILLICFVLAVILFFLAESKSNFPILLGSLLVVSALPFIKLESVFAYFANKFILELFSFLFTEAFSVSVKILILGGIFIAVGVALKFFKIGFWISEKFSKENTISKEKDNIIKEKSSNIISKK